MFRTSIVHLQGRSYAVCCSLVCLGMSCCYEGEGRASGCCVAIAKSIFRSVLMLYVAVWYVSICPVVMRVKEERLAVVWLYE